jgi:hypothetical protein
MNGCGTAPATPLEDCAAGAHKIASAALLLLYRVNAGPGPIVAPAIMAPLCRNPTNP